MLKSHRYWLGLFWLVAVFLLPLPLIQALAKGMAGTVNQSELFGAEIGSIAYVWMLFAIVVAEKPKWLDRLIGLPEMYFAHGIIGVGAIVLAFVHTRLLQSTGLIEITGNIALYTFIAVAVYSIFFMSGWPTSRSSAMRTIKKKLELVFRYETSVWIHRLNIFATLFVFAHVILIPYIRSNSNFMFIFYIYSGFTAIVYIYMHSLKRMTYKSGRLISNQQLADNVTELIVKIKGQLNFKAGDYVFISFPEIVGMKELHPFSLINYDRKKHLLIFAIRNEADFTAKIKNLPLNCQVKIDGTYGRLQNEIDEHPQENLIFIASGIGSVPLISLVLAHVTKHTITFVRIAHQPQDLIYESFLQDLAKKEEKLTYYSQVGRLSAEQVQSISDRDSFYLLGGSPQMMRGTRKMLYQAGVSKNRIYGEKFSF